MDALNKPKGALANKAHLGIASTRRAHKIMARRKQDVHSSSVPTAGSGSTALLRRQWTGGAARAADIVHPSCGIAGGLRGPALISTHGHVPTPLRDCCNIIPSFRRLSYHFLNFFFFLRHRRHTHFPTVLWGFSGPRLLQRSLQTHVSLD